jgi:hypothetical protein
MLKVAITAFATIAFIGTTLVPNSADAATRRHHRHYYNRHVVVAAAPAPYYGMPATYAPAPPFPFFLIPGPWWIPAH